MSSKKKIQFDKQKSNVVKNFKKSFQFEMRKQSGFIKDRLYQLSLITNI